jgi:hypothetical protein
MAVLHGWAWCWMLRRGVAVVIDDLTFHDHEVWEKASDLPQMCRRLGELTCSNGQAKVLEGDRMILVCQEGSTDVPALRVPRPSRKDAKWYPMPGKNHAQTYESSCSLYRPAYAPAQVNFSVHQGVIAMRMRVKWYVVRYLTKGIGGRRRRRRKVLAGKLTFRLSSTHCQKIMHIAYQCGDPIRVSFHCSKVLMYHCFYYRQDPSPCS